MEVGTLDGVGHGTALGGRYRLEERLQSGRTSSFWRAVDQTLERTVSARVVVGPTAEDTLDAARRAAMVEDARLLRVLDAGSERLGPGDEDPQALTYVIAERIHARPLTVELTEDGPLEAETVRALVGEAAQALERARLAGLHHCRLTTDSILRTGDHVKVAGLAVDAAVAGLDDLDDVTAARQDTVALVAVLYAGLTGRWPLGQGPALEPAPLVAGVATPPADLVSGVPNDLDTLCVVTLGPHDDGPRTPGELAAELAPWGADRAGQVPAAQAGRPAGSRVRPAAQFPVRLGHGETAGGAGGTTALATDPGQTAPMPRVQDPAPEMPAAASSAGGGGQNDGFSFAQAIGTGEYAEPPRGVAPAQKVVLAAVAAALLIGLVLAVNSLAGIGGDDDGREAAVQPTVTAPQTSPQQPTTQQPPTTTQPAAGTTAVISGVQTLDPQGDQTENDDSAPEAIDDDLRSYWSSSTYTTADFGGLKDGVGIVIELQAPAPVSAVTLAMNGSGGAFELRTAPAPGLGGSQVVASGTVTGQPVELTLEQPVETQHLIVWFTELPSTEAGFRIELASVAVR